MAVAALYSERERLAAPHWGRLSSYHKYNNNYRSYYHHYYLTIPSGETKGGDNHKPHSDLNADSNGILDADLNSILDADSNAVLDAHSNTILDLDPIAVLDVDSNTILDVESLFMRTSSVPYDNMLDPLLTLMPSIGKCQMLVN